MKELTIREKNIIQYIFLIILISITVYLISTTLDIGLIPDIIKMVDIKFIWIGILLVLIYIILESIIIKGIVNSISNKKVKNIGMKLATIGLYYNLVTPFASGSQPMQVYVLTKSDISISKSIAIITNKTFLYQSIVTLYSILFVVMNLTLLGKEMPSVMILIFIGITMNVVLLLMGIIILMSPKKVKNILGIILENLDKYKILKSLYSKREQINNSIDEFNISIKSFIKDTKTLIISVFLTIIQLTTFFSLVYCVYKAFGLHNASYLKLITLQVFLYMSISPIPTPGNVGANELIFLTIFKDIFPAKLIGYSVFLYSGFVYYFILFFCGIISIITHLGINKQLRKTKTKRENKILRYKT